MKTALEIIQSISYSTNAEINKVSSWGNVKNESLNGLNRAISLLWNSKQWNFRREIKKYALPAGKNTIPMTGSLAQNGIRVNNIPLTYDRSIPFYDPKTGKPVSYFISNKGKPVLYPSADKPYSVTIETYTPYPIVSASGHFKQEFTEETDILYIPEPLEKLFIDCLSYITNEVLNGDPTDEDYKEANLRYSEAYRLLEEVDTTKDYDSSKGFKMPWQT